MTTPIRVLELRSVFGTGGGPDKTLLASARRPNPRVQLTLCYLRNADDPLFAIGDVARRYGVDYVEILEKHSLDPSIWPALRRIVRAGSFDIVHGHEYKTNLLAYSLGKFEHVIPFATAHGWTGHSRRERYVYYPADKRLLARFPRVAAVSSEIKDTLVRAGAIPSRVDVVLNGIDANRFRRDLAGQSTARQAFGIPDGMTAIGAVGRLEPQKRFDLLIDAFATLRGAFPSTLLLIAGEGSLRQSLESQIARLSLTGSVRLVGHVDVIPFHHALDLFVQSSDYEGTPNVVLEAMALETPVIATDVGGTRELATDLKHGLIVPAGDLGRLSSALLDVLSDPAGAHRRAISARARVEKELTFDKRMDRIEAIYEELVAEFKRPSKVAPQH